MRVAITQPTYLPWVGYFALIDSCDKFMLLDDVQFVRRSWMHRNRLYDYELGKIRFLTIPVHCKCDEKIPNVVIADNRWKSPHYSIVRHLFRKAPYLDDVMKIMDLVYATKSRRLVDYTIPIIVKVREILGIQTPILYSSNYPEHNSFAKTERVVYLVEAVGGSRFLAQPTAVEAYLDFDEFRKRNLGLELFRYEHPHYQTGSTHFEPNMSVLELIGWVDPSERLKVLRSGVRIATLVEPLPSSQVD